MALRCNALKQETHSALCSVRSHALENDLNFSFIAAISRLATGVVPAAVQVHALVPGPRIRPRRRPLPLPPRQILAVWKVTSDYRVSQ